MNKATARLYRWTPSLSSSNHLNYINQERYPLHKTQVFFTPSPTTKKQKWEVETRQIQILTQILFNFSKTYYISPPRDSMGVAYPLHFFTVFLFQTYHVFRISVAPSPPTPRIFGAQVTPNPGDLVLSFGCAYPANNRPTRPTRGKQAVPEPCVKIREKNVLMLKTSENFPNKNICWWKKTSTSSTLKNLNLVSWNHACMHPRCLAGFLES